MSEGTKKSEPTEKESELQDGELEQVAGGDSASPSLFTFTSKFPGNSDKIS